MSDELQVGQRVRHLITKAAGRVADVERDAGDDGVPAVTYRVLWDGRPRPESGVERDELDAVAE